MFVCVEMGGRGAIRPCSLKTRPRRYCHPTLLDTPLFTLLLALPLLSRWLSRKFVSASDIKVLAFELKSEFSVGWFPFSFRLVG